MKHVTLLLLVLAAVRVNAASMLSTTLKQAKAVAILGDVVLPLTAGSEIKSGSVIQVDSTLVEFRLGGGGRLVAEPGARFIPKDTPDRRDGHVKLLSGEIVLGRNGEASVSTPIGRLESGDGITSVMYSPGSLEVVETLQIMAESGGTFFMSSGARISIPDAGMLTIRQGYAPVVSKLRPEALARLERLSQGLEISDSFPARKSVGAKPLPGDGFISSAPSRVEIAPATTVNISQFGELSPNGAGFLN